MGKRILVKEESLLDHIELAKVEESYLIAKRAKGLAESSINNDPETGYSNVIVERDITDDVEPAAITHAYLYRLVEGEREFLKEVVLGEQYNDELAPLNVDYDYEFLQVTNNGEIALARYTNKVATRYSFIYSKGLVFRGAWEPEFSVSLGRPERVEKRYSGRRYPVSYDSKAMEETCDYTTLLTERQDLTQLKTIMRKGNGQGIWKSADGDSYHANFEMSYDTNRYEMTQTWKVKLKVARIEQ